MKPGGSVNDELLDVIEMIAAIMDGCRRKMPMENENSKKKTTAPDTSVGADDGQPLHNPTENSISTFDEEINGDFQNSTESLDVMYRRIQRLTDPHYLHTISMTELYQPRIRAGRPL